METRDQHRARYAYEMVATVPKSERDEYEVAVNALGPNVMRSGLAVAITWLERDMAKRDAVKRLLGHLAGAGISGIAATTGAQLPGVVRALPLASYMLATRDLLKLTQWFKRAVQATFVEGGRQG